VKKRARKEERKADVDKNDMRCALRRSVAADECRPSVGSPDSVARTAVRGTSSS
jgi:hypothetical protein